MDDVKWLKCNESWVVERPVATESNGEQPKKGLVVFIDIVYNRFNIRLYPDKKIRAQCRPEDFDETERPAKTGSVL